MTEPADPAAAASRRSFTGLLKKIATPLNTSLALVGTLAGIGSFFIDFAAVQAPQSAPTVVATATVGSPSVPSRSAASAGSGERRTGACVTEAGTPTGCDGAHFGEIFATDGNCSQQALVEYAGGISTVDVLRSDLAITQPGACTVVLPPQLAGAGPLQDGLRQDGHEAFRQCQNRLTSREVACDQLHTAEVVFADPDHSADAAGCSAKADDYMGGSLARNAQKLDILTKTSGTALVCSVQAKGDNQLVGSLRNLGTTALPVRPMD